MTIRLTTRALRAVLIIAVLSLLVAGLTPFTPTGTAHAAQTPRAAGTPVFCPATGNGGLGCWADICPIEWANTTLTITFASDAYRDQRTGWATQACTTIAGSVDPNNQYSIIGQAARAQLGGVPVCVFGFAYGGYWVREHAPYIFTGQAQVAVRLDTSYDNAELGTVACGSFESSADQYNTAHGFNFVDDPTGTVCGNCGYGGGSGSGNGAPPPGVLPGNGAPVGALKATRHVKKPLICIYTTARNGKQTKTCHAQK